MVIPKLRKYFYTPAAIRLKNASLQPAKSIGYNELVEIFDFFVRINAMTTTKQPRVAKPGDTFILLVPSAQELHHLQQKQTEFQNQYGGQIMNHIHITCERFTPERAKFPQECFAVLKHQIANLAPFPVYSDAVIQFHAPYWQSNVLRWRIEGTTAWLDFRSLLTKTLKGIACPSHFDRQRSSTCSILTLDEPVELSVKHNRANNSHKLFTAQEVVISRLKENYQFEILETIQLSNPIK